MKKREFYDDEEKKVITAYERARTGPEGAKRTATQAARRYMRQDARINIRMFAADLEMLKQRAVEEGLPYQSLIASVLHKYVSRGGASRGQEGRRLEEDYPAGRQAMGRGEKFIQGDRLFSRSDHKP